MSDTKFMDRATAAYGVNMPDWIRVLAERTDELGPQEAARQCHFSPTAIYNSLRDKYPGSMVIVERKVRGAFMGAEVYCPELEAITATDCLGWQDKKLNSSSPQSVRMNKACRVCDLADQNQKRAS